MATPTTPTAPANVRLCACGCGGVLPSGSAVPRGSRRRKYLEGHSPKFARAIDASSLSEAEKFGVSKVMVDLILKGRAWLRLLEPGATPVSFRAQQTKCDRGHEITPANTLIRPNGARRCRTCKLEWRRVHRGVSSARTHCRRGHLVDAANSRTDRSGYTVCRTCHRDDTRAYKARQKAKAA
jgi:hypothetical protein